MSTEITESNNQNGQQKLAKRGLQLPPIIEAAGDKARRKFVESFIAQISNGWWTDYVLVVGTVRSRLSVDHT